MCHLDHEFYRQLWVSYLMWALFFCGLATLISSWRTFVVYQSIGLVVHCYVFAYVRTQAWLGLVDRALAKKFAVEDIVTVDNVSGPIKASFATFLVSLFVFYAVKNIIARRDIRAETASHHRPENNLV